jgi:CRP-like cAMP-binding protein
MGVEGESKRRQAMERDARTQAGYDPMKIEVETLMPGAMVIHADDEQILCGFPEEVAKACFAHNKQITAWLVPDVRSRDGIAQWALEFPLYVALFVQGLFAKGKKLTVFVQRKDWPDVIEYLRLTLLGLSGAEMRQIGVPEPTIDFLEREGAWLALKRTDGSIAQIEDFLHPVFFDEEGIARFGGLTVRAHGGNTWSFATEEEKLENVRLDVAGEQLPPYTKPLNPATTPIVAQQLEVITLGASNGFDISGPCSNMVVQAGGHFLLIDCGPYIKQVLEASGISLNQIEALVLTHAHEDHAVGLSALLQAGRRMKLFTTRESAEILRRKLAILNPEVENPRGLLDEAFELTCVEPGADYEFLGLALRFHYTMHSISCLGVELSTDDRGLTRRVLVAGDNASRPAIEKAFAAGVIDEKRHERLLDLYRRPCDLVIADAGGGLIHGVTADFEANSSTNVVYVHTGRLPEAEAHRFTLAAPGCRYTIIPENSRPTPIERDCAFRALAANFDCRSEWIGTLLDQASPVSVNRGQIVVRQNDLTRDFFVVLSGKLAVLVEDASGRPHKVAEIHPGEIFGEMAVINSSARSATVQALTPVRLLRAPGEALRKLAARENLAGQLRELWSRRSDIQSVDILARLPVSILNQLARVATPRRFEAGSTLIEEGEQTTTVFALVEGRVQIHKGGEPLHVNGAAVILHPGQLVGEMAPLHAAPRNASVKALDSCSVLEIPGKELQRVVESVPRLHYQISMVIKARCAA